MALTNMGRVHGGGVPSYSECFGRGNKIKAYQVGSYMYLETMKHKSEAINNNTNSGVSVM